MRTTKFVDIVPDPFESDSLVRQARVLTFWRDRWRERISKDRSSSIDSDDHDVVLVFDKLITIPLCKIGDTTGFARRTQLLLSVWSTGLNIATHPDQDGDPAIAVSRPRGSPDVEGEAVFAFHNDFEW